MRRATNPFTLILALILLVAVGFFVYKYYYLPSMTTAFNQKMNTALQTFYTGDYDASINTYSSLANSAPDKATQGKANVLLASSYMLRNQSGDQGQGIKIFKQVVNNYSIPPLWRAFALNNLAIFLGNNSSLSTYQLYFSDPPFNSLLPVSGPDSARLSAAYLGLLKLSDETAPNSYAEYAIAGNYYLPQLSANQFAVDAASKATAQLMQNYVKEGDTRNDSSLYAPATLLNATLYRALAMGGSNRVLKNLDPQDIDAAYQLVFQRASQFNVPADTGPVYAVLMRARFYYAIFLSTQPNSNSKIKENLAPFSKADPKDPNLSYFPGLVGTSSRAYSKSVAIQLADISPDFNEFLTKAGVVR
jgi:hypothetical protein